MQLWNHYLYKKETDRIYVLNNTNEKQNYQTYSQNLTTFNTHECKECCEDCLSRHERLCDKFVATLENEVYGR